jgi:hypothetical protein
MAFRLALSYHTETDARYADALAHELERQGTSVTKLDHLTLEGFSLPDGPGGGQLRSYVCIEHFVNILDACIGMVVIRSEAGHDSETTPGRGMWIEQRLASRVQMSPSDFVRFVDAPDQDTSDIGVWASERSTQLIPWLTERQQSGASVIARYSSQDVNVAQPYANHEIQFASSERIWFFISILDLYDRVWHCKRCLATSDVWLAPESRPPAECPACGYSGKRTE